MAKFFTYSAVEFAIDECPTCGVMHFFPKAVYLSARRHKSKHQIYCPNGHAWHYSGDSPEEQLRLERDRLVQRMAEKDDQIRAALNQRDKAQKELRATKRKVTRASHGVCTECNRSFVNVARHMVTKHKFKAEAVA